MNFIELKNYITFENLIRVMDKFYLRGECMLCIYPQLKSTMTINFIKVMIDSNYGKKVLKGDTRFQASHFH